MLTEGRRSRATMLYCSEEQVLVEKPGQDDEKETRLGYGDPYQTRYEKVGDLYRAAQKQYGRCVSYVMIDVIKRAPSQETRSIRVGWVFRRRHPQGTKGPMYPIYTDTWVTVYTEPPQRVWTAGTYAKVG